MTIVLTLPFSKPPLSPNDRLHFRQKAALTRQIREAAYWVAKQAAIAPAPPSAVLTVWFPPDRRRRDAGSLTLTAKAAIDGLVDAGVWPDDDPAHVVEERYRIGEVDRENPRIELHLIPARPAHCFVCGVDDPPARLSCGPHCHVTDADEELADRYRREGDHQ